MRHLIGVHRLANENSLFSFPVCKPQYVFFNSNQKMALHEQIAATNGFVKTPSSYIIMKPVIWKGLTILLVCLFVCYFVIFTTVENASNIRNRVQKIAKTQEPSTASASKSAVPRSWANSLAFIHVDSGFNEANDHNVSFLVILPYSTTKENISQELQEVDKLSLRKLSNFLGAVKDFDGATCLRQRLTQTEESGHTSPHQGRRTARNISLDSSWCRFITKTWSVHIRNTGPVQEVQLQKYLPKKFNREEMILLQTCNIVQGPYLIRKDIFRRIGGLIDKFGKLTSLEFFLRSKGELKMAKLSNCVWTPKITRADRGSLEGTNIVPEYASFANKYNILRIVTEKRIEWTACVANWKLCPEKPYVKPQGLPGIAAPICCSAVLGKMLTDFKRALNILRLEYRVVYGTLLGAVRSQAIIPWTYDVDIALPKAAFDQNASTFSALQKILGGQYHVGKSFGQHRAHPLWAPYVEIDTAPYFDGPDDLQGNALFSNELEEAVRGMLPVSKFWRTRCYVDFYKGLPQRMKRSSTVIINNEQFLTVKDVDFKLTNWYGKNYQQPAFTGNWSGLSDK